MSGSPPLLRRINQARVLAALRQVDVTRVGELAQATGLSRPTISAIVDELEVAGWAASSDEHPNGRIGLGRPARIVRFRSEAGYVVGIDIGAHRSHAVVADLDGGVVASAWRATSGAHDGRGLLKLARATATEALSQAGVHRDAVLSVAVGTPGIINRSTGVVVQAPGLPGWSSINLARELRRSFRCEIQVENDINLAVLGECWRGAAREANTVVFVGWGERIGAGICIGGRLHAGASNAAGEIGFFSVLDPHTEAAVGADGRGGLESRVGAGAIVDLARSLQTEGGAIASLASSRRGLDAAGVFAAARDGDPGAQTVVDAVVDRLARGLAPILLVLDPDMLVIGGGLSHSGPLVLDAVRDRLRRLTLVPATIETSVLGEDATALGAVRMALTDVEQRLMPSSAGSG